MTKEAFKISLAAARVNAGLKQIDVARALHVSTATVVSWEKGTTEPTVSQALELCSMYNAPFDLVFLPEESK